MEHVISTDGTRIAFERSGSGPALILVHGGMGDHTRWNPLVEHLKGHFTVYAMDRRGRGESGDALEYALEREYDDVAAVARAVDGPVSIYGHSYGVFCALGAAPQIERLHRLVLYEGPIPGIAELTPTAMIDRLENLIEQEKREEALVIALQDLVQMPPHEIEEYRSLPTWPARVAAVHTLPREERAWNRLQLDPEQYSGFETPVLLLVGGESPTYFTDSVNALHAALPNSRVHVLEGQHHAADVMAPELVASALIEFLNEDYA